MSGRFDQSSKEIYSPTSLRTSSVRRLSISTPTGNINGRADSSNSLVSSSSILVRRKSTSRDIMNDMNADEEENARRAAQRVIAHKRSEQEKIKELENEKQRRIDEDQTRRREIKQAKDRRRAEIYALNTIMRKMFEEKFARITTKRDSQSESRDKISDNCNEFSSRSIANLNQPSIGV